MVNKNYILIYNVILNKTVTKLVTILIKCFFSISEPYKLPEQVIDCYSCIFIANCCFQEERRGNEIALQLQNAEQIRQFLKAIFYQEFKISSITCMETGFAVFLTTVKLTINLKLRQKTRNLRLSSYRADSTGGLTFLTCFQRFMEH